MNKETDWKENIKFILYVAFLVLLSYCIIRYVGQRTVVSGSSMQPALEDGDNLIVDKISYRLSEPERFDIVVFPSETQKRTCYIKRIIALPGESIRIDEEGAIYINGEKLVESYGREVIHSSGIAANEILLGEDEYFVLGDNRNDSMDSRDARIGLVSREKIIGKTFFRIYPFKKIGKIVHQ